MGGGKWQPDAAALARLRRSIDRQPERWREVLAEDRFRKVFFPGVKAGDIEGCVKAFCKSNKEGALKTKPKVSVDIIACKCPTTLACLTF